MKLFTDYHALERVLSRISTANPPEGTVKRLSDALVPATARATSLPTKARMVPVGHSRDDTGCRLVFEPLWNLCPRRGRRIECPFDHDCDPR